MSLYGGSCVVLGCHWKRCVMTIGSRVQAVQPNWCHRMDRYIGHALHHTLVVTYLWAEEAWRGSGGVIIHTRSDIEQRKFDWYALYFTLQPQDMYPDDKIVDITVTSCNLGEQLFIQDLLTKWALDSTKGGGYLLSMFTTEPIASGLWPFVSLLPGTACGRPSCWSPVVELDQHHGMDIHIHFALHHTLMVTYLKVEEVWRGSDGVIIHTRWKKNTTEKLHISPCALEICT